jgi:glutamate dehydrogenase (NAD(P)+)
MLLGRNIFIIPDCVANAGGIMCSYFEQVQSNANDYWQKDEVFSKLDTKLTEAFHAVAALSKKRGWSMRDAAHAIAIQRVAESCQARGWV